LNWDDAQGQVFLEMQFNAQQTHYQHHFPQREHQIILMENHPIGMLDIVRRSEEIRVLDIILIPENRNSGIGASLMNNILKESDRSAKPVRLYVEKFNPALTLYRRLGFQIIEDTGVHYHMERLPRMK
jgi:ribosomal protein S18 acetylase RimI-like enzyme